MLLGQAGASKIRAGTFNIYLTFNATGTYT